MLGIISGITRMIRHCDLVVSAYKGCCVLQHLLRYLLSAVFLAVLVLMLCILHHALVHVVFSTAVPSGA